MQHEIVHGPSHALLKVQLAPGEKLIAEAGSMVTHSDGIGMEVKLNSGSKAGCVGTFMAIFVAIVRKFVGGDSFFVNHFTGAASGGSEVTIAPALNGSVESKTLQAGEKIMLTAGSYLASTPDINLEMRWGGFSSIFSKEGSFFVEASGPGTLFYNAYGGIFPVQVNGTYVVDNGHIVAFDSTLEFDIGTAGGGLMGMMASGEGLVCKFKGQGTVYLQSRNISSLVDWLARLG